MDSAKDNPPAPIRWLVAADVAWIIGGVLAYYTAIGFPLVTAIAVLIAIPGLMELRRFLRDPQGRAWLDRSFSFAVGTWAILAMMIVIPYIASQDGANLWESATYARVGLLVGSVGMLAWNAAAFQGLAAFDEVRSARLYAGFHLLLTGAAVYYAGFAGRVPVSLRGELYSVVDLTIAAALAAVPGLMWAVVMWRSRAELQPR